MERKKIYEKEDKIIYVEDGRCYKVFGNSYNKGDILGEAYAHARIEETDLCTPKLYGVGEMDGRWAVITEYIEGKTLQQLMDEHPDKMEQYLKTFVETQLKCQSQDCPRLSSHNAKMDSKICNTDLSATLRYNLHARVRSMEKSTRLCHGDFQPSKIIIGTDGLNYVLDWSHATAGAPEADTARSYMLFCIEGKKDVADKYLEIYCDKTGTDPERIKAWLPILAATQSL